MLRSQTFQTTIVQIKRRNTLKSIENKVDGNSYKSLNKRSCWCQTNPIQTSSQTQTNNFAFYTVIKITSKVQTKKLVSYPICNSSQESFIYTVIPSEYQTQTLHLEHCQNTSPETQNNNLVFYIVIKHFSWNSNQEFLTYTVIIDITWSSKQKVCILHSNKRLSVEFKTTSWYPTQ